MNMKLTFRFGSLISLILIVLSGCVYDQVVPKTIDTDQYKDMSFANDIVPIFNESCNMSGCHNAGGINPDLSPTGAYNALSNGNYIDTNSPATSELYRWMNGEENLSMPLTGPDPVYNAKVLAWIEQGALDN
jgi:hypothetical protein